MLTTVGALGFFVHFFSGVPQGLYVVVSAIPRQGERKLITRAMRVEDIEEVLPWIEQYKPTHDLYFRTSVLTSPPLEGRGTENDTDGASHLWIDCDLYKSGMSMAQALAYLAHNDTVPPPTACISSGGGLHVYWKLSPYCRDIQAMKGRNEWLRTQFLVYGADNVGDYARILRVPETFNYKDGKVRPVSIVGFYPKRIYTLNDFTWLEPPSTKPRTFTRLTVVAATTTNGANGHTPVLPVLPDAFLVGLEEKGGKYLCNRILTQESAKRERADLDAQGDVDNSRNDFQIARGLHRLKYSEDDIAAVLSHPIWFSGQKFREKGSGRIAEDYVNHTIEKVLELPPVDIDQFFEGKKFIPLRMLRYLQAEGSHFLMHSMSLWVYNVQDGVYRPNGEAFIRHEVAILMGEYWKAVYSADTVTLCTDMLLKDYTEYLLQQSQPERKRIEDVVINTKSGMLNVLTGKLSPHSPLHKSTMQYPVYSTPIVPDGTSPIEQFVAENLPADAIKAWWEWVGYHFLEDMRYRRGLYLIGPGRTGKSTLLAILERFIGTQNVTAKRLQQLCDDRFTASELVGKVANIFNDLDMTELKHSGLLKTFFTGDRLPVEKKFKDSFEAYFVAKHSYSANGFVPLADSDKAYFDRWIIIRMGKQFNEGGLGDGDRTANVRLLDELSTTENMSIMLHLAREGLIRLCKQGHFSVGPSMQKEVDDYRAQLDSVFSFLTTTTLQDHKGFIIKQDLYHAYVAYCGNASRGVLGDKKFWMKMKDEAKEFGMIDGRRKIGEKMEYGYSGRILVAQTPTIEAKKRGITIVKQSGRS